MQAQQHREPFVVIDAKPNQQNKAELLDVITELRGIIQDTIKAIS